MPVHAFVMMNISEPDPQQMTEKLNRVDAIKTAFVVTGPYDIIATVEADNISELSNVIMSEIHPMDGIERTLSCIVLAPIKTASL